MVPGKKPPQDASKKSTLKIAAAALAASSIENYDFFIYGTAAALVFPDLFFPGQSPLAGALLSFSTFAIGFIARPVGAVIFGHLGDVHGRKRSLVMVLLTMGLGTTLIGVLPTYDAIGPGAPLLLVLLRLVQGIALGGQTGGVILLAMESAPPRRRGFYSSFALAGGPAGILVGNFAFLIADGITDSDSFDAWGWRLPFLASVALLGLTIYIQLRIEETKAFKRLQRAAAAESGEEAGPFVKPKPEPVPEPVPVVVPEGRAARAARSPVLEALRRYPRRIVLIGGAYIGINVTYYLFMTFAVAYGTNDDILDMPKSRMLLGVLCGAAVQLVMLPVAGALSDRFGRRGMLTVGSALVGVWAFVFWPLLNTESPVVIVIAFVVGLGLLHTTMYAPQGAFFAETFPTETRYSAMSLSIQVASVVGGALAPLIATSLYAWTDSWLAIAAYMAGVCLITVVSVLLLPETYRIDVEETAAARPAEADEAGTVTSI
ncbi:MFS transporter [Actinomadura sp. NEAU-AAG7]|uniref:MFS transporter n=1 Tax=Actinomadura sp. NEAU-AAG7 TaxID=2839640 RepID=UPI001BE4B808|nr:MFS transporter [Actinomadura sp. NEAU-AAG7]MBT2207914.1 MHS family MFS transporter [Actinomadura sp. NEAU-AAG7]